MSYQPEQPQGYQQQYNQQPQGYQQQPPDVYDPRRPPPVRAETVAETDAKNKTYMLIAFICLASVFAIFYFWDDIFATVKTIPLPSTDGSIRTATDVKCDEIHFQWRKTKSDFADEHWINLRDISLTIDGKALKPADVTVVYDDKDCVDDGVNDGANDISALYDRDSTTSWRGCRANGDELSLKFDAGHIDEMRIINNQTKYYKQLIDTTVTCKLKGVVVTQFKLGSMMDNIIRNVAEIPKGSIINGVQWKEVSKIRFEAPGSNPLNLGELAIYTDNGMKRIPYYNTKVTGYKLLVHPKEPSTFLSPFTMSHSEIQNRGYGPHLDDFRIATDPGTGGEKPYIDVQLIDGAEIKRNILTNNGNKSFDINYLVLHNRLSCCWDRLKGVKVYFMNSAEKVIDIYVFPSNADWYKGQKVFYIMPKNVVF